MCTVCVQIANVVSPHDVLGHAMSCDHSALRCQALTQLSTAEHGRPGALHVHCPRTNRQCGITARRAWPCHVV